MRILPSVKCKLIACFFALCMQGHTMAQEPVQLLVRADDMGVNHEMNHGIIRCYQEGIVTSASIMPTSPYFGEAVRLCKENPGLAVGIHLTLLGTRERPVLSPEEVPSLVTPQGFFHEDGVSLEKANPVPEEIERELRAQIGKVRATGLHFVYLDWHRTPPKVAQDIILKLCREQQLIYAQGMGNDRVLDGGYRRTKVQPDRVTEKHELPGGHTFYYPASHYTEEVKQSFFEALSTLAPGRWWGNTHPGLYDAKGDLTALLCDPRTLEIIKRRNIQLVSYADLWQEKYGKGKH